MTVHLVDHATGQPLLVPMGAVSFHRWWECNKSLYIHMLTVTDGDDMTVMVTEEQLKLEQR